MCDYRKGNVFKDGHPVSRLRMRGLIAEYYWRRAFHMRVGLNQCAWQDAAQSGIPLYNVVIDGRRRAEVQATVNEDDAKQGLTIATAVAGKLLEEHYFILDAIVPVHRGGRLVGDHDLVCERRFCKGLSSVEVKCRHIETPKLLREVREQIQKEAMPVFQAACSSPAKGPAWSERVAGHTIVGNKGLFKGFIWGYQDLVSTPSVWRL
jgi:hypothetical protein